MSKDLTRYATAAPTPTMEAFADFLIAEVFGGALPDGVDESAFRTGVALGGSTRGYFQASDAWKEDPRNYLANVEANRVAKTEERAAKAREARAKAEAREAKALADLEAAVAAAKAKVAALAAPAVEEGEEPATADSEPASGTVEPTEPTEPAVESLDATIVPEDPETILRENARRPGDPKPGDRRSRRDAA